MKVFILLSLVAGALAVLDCPVHQHYESCGTACPLTCDNHNDPPQACILMCNPGCHCDPGYVKTKSGSCVKPESCNTNEVCTGENQRYNECGTACPLTCDNYMNPPKACTKQCVVGCECQEGYVKNKQGECVLPAQCPSFASSLCELEAETGMCRGYFPRYFFNKASGKCERFIYGGCGGNENNFKTLSECHDNCAAEAANAVCGENEEFTNCGTACPMTCDNIDNPPKVCTLQCVIGCQCQKGYVRNAEGKCVLPEQCPSKAVCGKNQVYQECGTACPLTCENLGNPPKVCTLQCVVGCACQEGYVKNSEGECVKPEQCKAHNLCELKAETGMCRGYFPRYHFNKATGQCEKFIYGGCGGNGNNFETIEECHKSCGASAHAVCGVNQEFQECGTACPLTCYTFRNPLDFCTDQCVIGCACQKGYVQNAQGECVLPEQCPSQAQSLCELEIEEGMCRGYFPRFAYNKATGQCEEFIYGGCGGNENNFETIEECHSSCAASANAVCGANQEFHNCGTACPLTCDNYKNPPKFCTLQCVIGCACQKGYVKTSDGRCVLPEQCESAQNALDRPDCDKAPETGVCKASHTRWYYDQEAGMCQIFIYGGCGGNRNNFESRDECYNKCGALAPPKNALCAQEKVIGPCRAAFPRYFYNQKTGACEKFIYGGCQGNANNFFSEEECHATCLA
ncbi:hypothetical protein JTE90_026060 [Oedothorax gibbosus]|uniref:BPTI/Kunitz inhibitor domain-containing protein n=1 Tax=Oedothorax gibbosus TaxID=931172 RepID=A0AAV6UBI8_9ARAC|nr:hypothetical protein JTE90_026060 [Oedothorax gibbosus]